MEKIASGALLNDDGGLVDQWLSVRPRRVGDSNPSRVGTQHFDGYLERGLELDGRSTVFRDRANAGNPLRDQDWRQIERARELGSLPSLCCESLKVHGRDISAMLLGMLAPREYLLIARRYPICCMRTIELIRHARLLELLASKDYPTIQSLATRIGTSHSQLSQWKNRSPRKNKKGEITGVSNIDSDSARAIEAAVGKPKGWMDNDPAFEKAVIVDTPRNSRAPRSGPVDFTERRVTDSEYALLEDLRVMPEEELEALRIRAQKNKEHLDRVLSLRDSTTKGDEK